MSVAKASLRSLWWREVQGVSGYTGFDSDKTGMGDITLNRIPTVSPIFGRQADGTFGILIDISAAPGDFDSFELMFLEDDASENRLLQMLRDLRPIYFQRLTYACPPTNNRSLWKTLEHFKVVPDSGSLGASPNRDGSDSSIESRVAVKVLESTRLYRTSLSGLTTTEAEPIACVDGLKFPNDCLSGYPGADKILVFGADAGSGVVANALYSVNGGSTISAFTTDPSPFTEIDRHIVDVVTSIISETQFRVVYFAGTVAAVKAQWAYQDFNIADSSLTAASWNQITIAATAATDAMETAIWYPDLGRGYVAAAGDIYVSTDNWETDPGAASYSGANAFAQFGRDEDNNVWAVGAANTILRELANNRGTFSARTGPTGGGAFTSIAFADDGTIFAGNGTSVFKNTDKANSTGAWTSLKDFGASHSVIALQCKNGTSQCLRAIVDDTTPGVGSVYESEDGGNTWRLVTETANDGYNEAYFSTDPNKAILVGDDVGSLGVIELLN